MQNSSDPHTPLQRPTFVCLAAQSRDGFIAKDATHRSETWVSPEDKKHFQAQLQTFDWLVAGRNTASQYVDAMTPYNCLVLTTRPDEHLAEHFGHIDPTVTDPVEYLTQHGAERVAVLGGTNVYSYFLEHNLLDEVWLTIEPTDFRKGLPAFNKPYLLEEHLTLKSREILNDAGTELLYYKKDLTHV